MTNPTPTTPDRRGLNHLKFLEREGEARRVKMAAALERRRQRIAERKAADQATTPAA